MKPNFKEIDIKAKASHSGGTPQSGGNWMTPELIPVKQVYTKEDLEEMEHLGYAAGLPPI